MVRKIKPIVRRVRLKRGDERLVTFRVITTRQAIKCSTRGKPPINVIAEDGKFHAFADGNWNVTAAKTPDVAFAHAVKQFWR